MLLPALRDLVGRWSRQKEEIPDAINPPSGCAFYPKCQLAVKKCSETRPEMRQLAQAWVACHVATDQEDFKPEHKM